MKEDKDLNIGFYQDLDTNFEEAFLMSEKAFTHEELLHMLQIGNIPQKQIAALKFDYVNNQNDAKILLSNLTGCDGKIRETVALTINRILNTNPNSRKIFSEISFEKFADATIDINANICRLVVDSAVILKEFEEFSINYTNRILEFTKQAFNEIDKFIFRDKKYVINKQIFKLYWCLDALIYFQDFVNIEELEQILTKASAQKEYTIREKAAQIIMQSGNFSQLYDKLKTDENYYVRQVLKID